MRQRKTTSDRRAWGIAVIMALLVVLAVPAAWGLGLRGAPREGTVDKPPAAPPKSKLTHVLDSQRCLALTYPTAWGDLRIVDDYAATFDTGRRFELQFSSSSVRAYLFSPNFIEGITEGPPLYYTLAWKTPTAPPQSRLLDWIQAGSLRLRSARVTSVDPLVIAALSDESFPRYRPTALLLRPQIFPSDWRALLLLPLGPNSREGFTTQHLIELAEQQQPSIAEVTRVLGTVNVWQGVEECSEQADG